MNFGSLGKSAKDRMLIELTESSDRDDLLIELKRLNDYMALMSDTVDPPHETQTTDDIE